MFLMEDQIDTNRFGRTETILENHREIGVNASLVHFFQGELYRQRNEDGDPERALLEYQLAAEGEPPIPDAHLNLGYLYLKQGEFQLAKQQFARYLELKPDADDRAMVEFYLEEESQ